MSSANNRQWTYRYNSLKRVLSSTHALSARGELKGSRGQIHICNGPIHKRMTCQKSEWGQLIYFTHLYNVYIKSQTISYVILYRDDYVRSINRTIKKINHIPKHPFWHLRVLVSVVAF
jgi:hypothetical protein